MVGGQVERHLALVDVIAHFGRGGTFLVPRRFHQRTERLRCRLVGVGRVASQRQNLLRRQQFVVLAFQRIQTVFTAQTAELLLRLVQFRQVAAG